MELQTNDRKTWDYLEQSFSISKSKIPFTSIGSDHAMEQETKRMKISGVIGLTQNANALNRFCLTAPLLNNILEPFYNLYDVTNSSKRQYHYKLSGTHLSRMCYNIRKLVEMMQSFNLNFDDNSCVFNVVSKAVLPDSVADEVLNNHVVGDDLYQEFIEERLKGEKSVWSSLKKRKLKTFKTQGKMLKSKVEGKVVQLKEEKVTIVPISHSIS